MHAIAPAPPGDGAVMWWASAVDRRAEDLAEIVAPRGSRATLELLEHERRRRLRSSRSRRARRRTGVDTPARRERGHVGERRPCAVGVMAGLAAAGEHGVAASVRDERAPRCRWRASTPRTPSRWSRTVPATRSASRWRPPAALAIIIGTRNGETRRSPFSWRTLICSRATRARRRRCRCTRPCAVGSTGGSPLSSSAIGGGGQRELRRPGRLGALLSGCRRTVSGRSRRCGDTGPGQPSPSSPLQKASLPVPHGPTTPKPVTTTRPRRLHQSFDMIRS